MNRTEDPCTIHPFPPHPKDSHFSDYGLNSPAHLSMVGPYLYIRLNQYMVLPCMILGFLHCQCFLHLIFNFSLYLKGHSKAWDTGIVLRLFGRSPQSHQRIVVL